MDEPIAATLTPEWLRGKTPLPWSWAVERLEAERNYWLATVRRDGFPQARPVWGTWSDAGLLLSVGFAGLQRARDPEPRPITVHVDSAIDVVIIEGVINRVARSRSGEGQPTFEVDAAIRRAATERYNAKYSWNFDVDGGGLNFLVRPHLVFGWHSTDVDVDGGTKWVFPVP